jgi:hypothetical protein
MTLTLEKEWNISPLCRDCLYWDNTDDPDESCKNSPGARPSDEACRLFERGEV